MVEPVIPSIDPRKYLKTSAFCGLQEAVYMAIAEKQARLMACAPHRRKTVSVVLRAIQHAVMIGPFAVFAMSVAFSLFGDDNLGELTFDLFMWIVVLFPLLLIAAVPSSLPSCCAIAGSFLKLLELGLMSVFCLFSLTSICAVLFENGALRGVGHPLVEALSLFLVHVPMITGLLLVTFFGRFFLVANSKSISLTSEIFSLVSIVTMLMIPNSIQLMRDIALDFDGDIGAFATFMELFPISFILVVYVVVLTIARLKRHWSEKFFYGNDINESRVFVIPSRVIEKDLRTEGMRQYKVRFKSDWVTVPAKFFLIEKRHGEGYRRGSIIRNISVFFFERACRPR